MSSSALLGIIGPGTFDSPWIPYEIGGARGRHSYARHIEIPNPRIAHLIHGVNPSKVPAFVGLGTPLRSRDEVKLWAECLVAGLQNEYISPAKKQELQGIYTQNTQDLKLASIH